jgi:hypothetical protein
MRKLPARYGAIVMPLVLSVVMSCIVSLIATLRAAGFDGFAFGGWLQAWGLSWLVAFPTLLLVLPFVRRLVGLLVEKG